MTDWIRPDPKLVVEAIREPGFEVLTRADIDIAVAATWDSRLVRRQRLLVPVDVQAYVVPAQPVESTVAVAGLPTDPVPFDAGTIRPRGVHLHWALPDSLLRGRQVDADAIGDAVEFPLLPDRWVVVRTLLPVGRERALVRGWVIDATTKVVTPLAEFGGTPAPPADATDRLERLDASYGGGLLWTASYEASAGRFGFHDPLDDLEALKAVAPSGLHGDLASYTVAGWWSDAGVDALAGSTGTAAVDARLASLGWYVDHEGRVELFTRDAQFDARLMDGVGFASVDDQPTTKYALQGMKKTATSPHADPQIASPIDDADEVIIGPARLSYLSLLHGSVLGVPLGDLPTIDGRPAAASVSAVLGLDIDDLFAAFGATGLTSQNAQRTLSERLAAAFTGDLLEQLDQPDGLADLAEREHNDGFWPLAGPPLPGVQPDILHAEDSAAVNPTTVGRKGRAATVGSRKTGGKQAGSGRGQKGVRVKRIQFFDGESASDAPTKPPRGGFADDRPAAGSVRSVIRPAPRVFRPQAPMIGLRNARPSLRHHGDGLHDDTGRLRCRYPSEAGTSYEGVLRASELIPTLGSGAIPPEVLTVVREALLLDPYAEAWHAAATSRGNATFESAVRLRLSAEYARLYGTDATYSGSGTSFMAQGPVTPRASSGGWKQRAGQGRRLVEAQIGAEVSKMSTFLGTMPSPVAITTWRQPWVPLWLEWEVRLRGSSSLDGWRLGPIDLEPSDSPTATTVDTIDRTLVGRSAVGRGAGIAIQEGINRWLDAERKRDTAGQSTLNAADQRALGELANLRAPLDLVSASMDGVREQLLGVEYVGQIERDPGTGLPVASELPVPLFGGALEVLALRLVDAFGRTLDIDASSVMTTTTLEIGASTGVAGAAVPSTIRLRPRLQHSARWLFRLVDPAHQSATAPQAAREAFVNQSRPDLGVNPIAGYLLPDHIDEALEFFDTAGAPIGQLDHDGLSGAVRWETAPGRLLPPDAGPLADLAAQSRLMGQLALGLAEVDVASRQLADPPGDTPLTGLLRAVDTTLWTVDTMAAVGTPSIAGLVSRPIAVVRATLRLDVLDDVAEVHITHAGGVTERLAGFQAVDRERFPVRLGDLGRTDDGLLGFFVDDDYRRFHVVDRVVAAQAIDSGRHRGHLGLHGADATATVRPLDSPYIVAEDELLLRPGETVRLTMLMLPGGRVHLTSGILPRKALALADDWVRLGLQRIVPSVRVGPLLIDPGDVRLPKIHTLGESQSFIRRTGPLTWREDPIVSATSAALLPRLPHELAEGWIRVTPESGAD